MSKKVTRNEIADAMFAEVERQLNEGKVPWHKPFRGFEPTSASTGKPYRGWNWLWLTLIQEARGYESNLWLTYNRAKQLGGHVRKGERATDVFFTQFNAVRKVERIDPATGDKVEGRATFPIFKAFSVFNLDQCDGVEVPSEYLIKREPMAPLDATAKMMEDYKDAPSIFRHKEGRAYYAQLTDSIHLPKSELFDDASAEFRTMAHEMTHSTGHGSRLDRWKNESTGAFGCENYSKEELVAEMGAAMLSGHYGVEIDWTNSGSYIAGWLRSLREDKTLLLSAITKANQAVERITGEVAREDAKAEEEVSA